MKEKANNQVESPHSKIRKSIQLLWGVFLIWLLVWQVGPLITQHHHDPVMTYAEEHDVEVGALFYTESPLGLEANYLMLKSR